jgi:8-oxo-dGTP diphosphatase
VADPAPVVVTAAVIERDGRFLVTRRLEGTHLAGAWEFPGGKCEAGEGLSECLAREIREELNATVRVGGEILRTRHAYPDRAVELRFFRCDLDGEPTPMLGQEILWVERAMLRTLEFPPADSELIKLLTG